MDRSGADLPRSGSPGEDHSRCQLVPLVLPIGAEETFKGVVDLIRNVAMIWDDNTQGYDLYHAYPRRYGGAGAGIPQHAGRGCSRI